MAARFPELWESGLICQPGPKNSENTKKATKISLKEIESDKDQLVPSKAKLCFSPVFLSKEERGSQFPKKIQ